MRRRVGEGAERGQDRGEQSSARQDFAEEWKGSIEAGKAADLCVLDRPLLDRDPHTLMDAEVDLTVFDGRIVHER